MRLITFTVEFTSISFFRTLSALCFKSTLCAHEPTMLITDVFFAKNCFYYSTSVVILPPLQFYSISSVTMVTSSDAIPFLEYWTVYYVFTNSVDQK